MVRLKNTSQYYYKKILAVYEKFNENLQQFFENPTPFSSTVRDHCIILCGIKKRCKKVGNQLYI